MRILILNGSPSGEDSITLQTLRYLEILYPDETFETLHAAQKIRAYEKDFSPAAEALGRADLILFAYPVYTFLVPAQLHRFLQLMKEQGPDLSGKYASQISTSKHFYDTTAHAFIRDNSLDLGLKYLPGLSQDMEDLLTEKGRREAKGFFAHLLWQMENGFGESQALESPLPDPDPATVPETDVPKKDKRVVIVTDLSEDQAELSRMIRRFMRVMPCACEVVNLREFSFAGGCLGCFQCASDGKCVYRDGFDSFLREKIQTADATVYAFSVRDHSMGYRMKLFDDRQFCNGHRTVTMGSGVGYLVDGCLSREENLRTVIEARAQVGGNSLAGVACNEADTDAGIDRMAAELDYIIGHGYTQPANFYGVGGLKIFRDLIYRMQGLMREDHRFYKARGFYDDFPQKHRGQILAMYLVGAMMRSPKLRAKAGSRMTEGMLMPYKKILSDLQSGKIRE